MNPEDIDHKAILDGVRAEFLDSFDEELEMEIDDERLAELAYGDQARPPSNGIDRRLYFSELFRLQGELVKLQDCAAQQAQGGRAV